MEKEEKEKMTLHANVSDTSFDQRSPQTLEEGVLN